MSEQVTPNFAAQFAPECLTVHDFLKLQCALTQISTYLVETRAYILALSKRVTELEAKANREP